jgi:hypothetical protein
MSRVTLELDVKQVENLVEKLPLQDKLVLAQRLNLETWQIRFKNLLSKIDVRLKNRPVLSNEKIVEIVKRVRKRNYAQSHH